MPNLALPLLALSLFPAQETEPPARALSRALTSQPRLASTEGGHAAARWVGEVLEEAGFEVTLDERVVLLSLPRRLSVRGTLDGEVLFDRTDTFDPDASPSEDVPAYNAWSASGLAEGVVLDVGRGLRADYEALEEDPRGKIALARYGGSYRGVKASLAEEHGCIGLLLYNDPAEDGPQRGAAWPRGPWKPTWAAQRGAISPLAWCPGDPSTPGWPSGAPGEETRRRERLATDATLPRIPVLPIGSGEAVPLREASGRARVWLDLDLERSYRLVVNVLGTLPGKSEEFVVAGNHRDAWVRGAQDAASGSVSLLRAAQHLGARASKGWKPQRSIVLAFWDAEEFGLIGSTEWGEEHAARLVDACVAYVNADAMVGGTRFRASGTPGLQRLLRSALERVPDPDGADRERSLWDQWSRDGSRPPALSLPGSGSDFTVFLHHLGLPVLDLGFGGNGGGGYHTSFDDFELMDRFLDPTWAGHETAGRLVAELLTELATQGRRGFDPREAASAMARMTRKAGDDWLGEEHGERLGSAFDRLAREAGAVRGDRLFYRALFGEGGLPGRPWYRNRLWAPGFETGYAAEMLPALRSATAAERGPLVDDLVASVEALQKALLADERAGD